MSQFYVSGCRVKAFKSVGSSWLDVTFEQGLNAIVGPNGCGKSNLLEAICFAFAAPASTFGVPSLSALQNSDCSEVCEVHVQLSHCRASTVHTVSALLAPDGSRNRKLNGKNKTGKEVKEFLRSVGISVDSSGAVIKQAQVTRLADLNSPAELAAVVADASGLGRWNQERRTAAEELARTSTAITAVQEKLRILELSLEEDSKALAALQRLEAIEAELGTAESDDAAKLGAALAGCEASLTSAVQQVEALQLDVAAREKELAALESKQHKLEMELAAAGAGTQDAAIAKIQRAALQEEVAILLQQIRDYAQQQELLEERREAVQLTSTQLAQITAMLPAALAGGGSGQGFALPTADIEACTRTFQRLTEEKARLESMLSLLPLDPVAPSKVAQLQQESVLLDSKQRERESLLASVRSQQSSLAAPGTAPCTPLHLCFSFQKPGACSGLATTLDIIAGKYLDIYVAVDLQTASQCLSMLGGSRVWAADCLSPADNRARFVKAAASFAPGEVIVPTELLTFDSKYAAAVLRAFGSYVIARDGTVAAALLQKFGISSVTLDGQISQAGSLQGGWRPERRGPSKMQVKLRCDELRQALAKAEQEVHSLECSVQQLQDRVNQHEQGLEERAQVEFRLKAVREEIRSCQASLGTHALLKKDGLSATSLQARLQQLQQEMRAHRQDVQLIEDNLQPCEADKLTVALECKQTELFEVEESIQRAQAAARQQQEQCQALDQQMKAIQQESKDQRSGLSTLSQKLTAAQQLREGIVKQQARLIALTTGKDKDDHPSKSSVQAGPEAAAAGPFKPMSLEELSMAAKECTQQHKAVARLQAEKAALANSCAGSMVHERSRARQAAYRAHLQQLETLRGAVATLEEYIAGCNGMVVHANNEMAGSIVSLFQSLVAEILPKYAFEAQLQGTDAHEGLHLKYAQSGGEGEAAWTSSLDALSGGQRTLISLAFILASNIAGSGCGVLLMDEVDAALDEANQHLVGRLFRHMLTSKGSGCAQVLCVSHNAALQELCSHLVSLRPAQAKRARH